MRKLALWVLVCLAPSCGGTSAVLYTGQDTAADDGKLGIIGDKSKGRVTACRLDHLLNVDLPYAEDWKAESNPQWLIFAKSTAAEVVATVQGARLEKRLDEETYLRDEVLKNIQETFEKSGARFKDIAISKHKWGRTDIDIVRLEYLSEFPMGEGKVLRQMHFWSVRQENGNLYRVHVSTTCTSEPKRTELIDRLRNSVGNGFIVLPRPTK